MTPTNLLRWVERRDSVKTYRVLQQWWEEQEWLCDRCRWVVRGEWRDVPLEKEK